MSNGSAASLAGTPAGAGCHLLAYSVASKHALLVCETMRSEAYAKLTLTL
jgi:hypothetical protein